MSRWYEIRVFVKAGGDYDATMAGIIVDKALSDYTRDGLSVVRAEEKKS